LRRVARNAKADELELIASDARRVVDTNQKLKP
jgi:hypothetical protein